MRKLLIAPLVLVMFGCANSPALDTKFIGDKSSMGYFAVDDQHVLNIPVDQRVEFKEKSEAEGAGYVFGQQKKPGEDVHP